jgi:hypothetical protein
LILLNEKKRFHSSGDEYFDQKAHNEHCSRRYDNKEIKLPIGHRFGFDRLCFVYTEETNDKLKEKGFALDVLFCSHVYL